MRRHRLHRGDEAAHGGDFAVDPRGESLHEIAHRMCIYADGYDDFNAPTHVHARREAPRARTDANRERVARAARFEQG